MASPLQPLDKPLSLHLSVQTALRRYIVDNRLQAGEPLPPEGELARQLGIGRNSVREGIKALESLGVLEVRRGVGAFVRAFTLAPLLENLPYAFGDSLREVQDILQIRQALELSLIESVLQTITDAQLAELRRILQAMEIKAARGQDFAEEDRGFHQALFAPLHNQMLLALIDAFWTVFHRVAGPARLETQEPMKTWRDHQAIFEAASARDLQATKQRLANHYTGIATRLERRRAELDTAAAPQPTATSSTPSTP